MKANWRDWEAVMWHRSDFRNHIGSGICCRIHTKQCRAVTEETALTSNTQTPSRARTTRFSLWAEETSFHVGRWKQKGFVLIMSVSLFWDRTSRRAGVIIDSSVCHQVARRGKQKRYGNIWNPLMVISVPIENHLQGWSVICLVLITCDLVSINKKWFTEK